VPNRLFDIVNPSGQANRLGSIDLAAITGRRSGGPAGASGHGSVAITAANPGVFTPSSGHEFVNGDIVLVTGVTGTMATPLNNLARVVANVVAGVSFELTGAGDLTGLTNLTPTLIVLRLVQPTASLGGIRVIYDDTVSKEQLALALARAREHLLDRL